jgi:prepilin-type N-terminal cleavage/methylation domain-containing protein
MKTTCLGRNQKGFTLIEIIAVLVILGILAAVAIPKYIDMRDDAVAKAVVGVSSELNARERLTLAQWKLQGNTGYYTAPDTKMGPDWANNAVIVSGTGFQHEKKTVTCTRTAQASENEPASWVCVVSAGT